MSEKSLIRLAAQRLATIARNDVPATLEDKVFTAVVDYLGAIACGHQAPWGQHIRQYARARTGMPESFSWGTGSDVSAESAAFVNATLAHSAIRDDMHLTSNSHIGSMVISAALALAQREKWTGEQLTKSIVGGYEVASLLGAAVQQSKSYNRHMRPSGICGAFGAAGAAVTASLVSSQISEDNAVNALAFAANMSSGFNEWAWAGGLEIYQEMGSAAQAGIVAFDLARAGMQCSETVLEGTAGTFAAVGAAEGDELFRDGLQKPIGQGLLDVRFKPAPGCNYAQTPLAAALRLATEQKLSSDNIKDVAVFCTIGAKNYPGCDNPGPFSNVQQTKMSIQFGVCAVLFHAEISEKLFQRFSDPHITQLAAACTVERDQSFDGNFREGRQPARIEVTLKDGARLIEELSDVPWLDKAAVFKRFHTEMESMIPSETSRATLIKIVEGLRSESDCTKLFEMFKTAKLVHP